MHLDSVSVIIRGEPPVVVPITRPDHERLFATAGDIYRFILELNNELEACTEPSAAVVARVLDRAITEVLMRTVDRMAKQQIKVS